MDCPTAINIKSRPYFQYYAYDIQTGEVDRNHSNICCCEENPQISSRCSYVHRVNEKTDWNHKAQWVSISSFPYSRLPNISTELNNDKIENQGISEELLLQSIVLFFSKGNVADVNVESSEFMKMCVTIFNFSNPSAEKEQEFISILNKFTRKRFSEKKKIIANKKREALCNSLKEEYVNLLIDSGTYGNTTKNFLWISQRIFSMITTSYE
jgi:hypothetical protein